MELLACTLNRACCPCGSRGHLAACILGVARFIDVRPRPAQCCCCLERARLDTSRRCSTCLNKLPSHRHLQLYSSSTTARAATVKYTYRAVWSWIGVSVTLCDHSLHPCQLIISSCYPIQAQHRVSRHTVVQARSPPCYLYALCDRTLHCSAGTCTAHVVHAFFLLFFWADCGAGPIGCM